MKSRYERHFIGYKKLKEVFIVYPMWSNKISHKLTLLSSYWIHSESRIGFSLWATIITPQATQLCIKCQQHLFKHHHQKKCYSSINCCISSAQKTMLLFDNNKWYTHGLILLDWTNVIKIPDILFYEISNVYQDISQLKIM